MYLPPAQPIPIPWRGFGGDLGAGVFPAWFGVLSTAWHSDNPLLLIDLIVFLVIIYQINVLMRVQQMCVKTNFCGFWALEVFHVLLAALCV